MESSRQPTAVNKSSLPPKSEPAATETTMAQSSATVPPPYAGPGQLRVLIVDDEKQVRVACEAIARGSGYAANSTGSGEEALQAVANEPYDVILLDIRMPDVNGLELLEQLRTVTPASYIVMMTGYASVESAVEAMKKGAYHYIRKPFHIDELRILLQRIESEIMASNEARMWRSQVNTSCAFGRMIGSSGVMQQVFRLAAHASGRNNPLLVAGEKGTGKELLCRCIHDCSERHDKPFLVIDCDSAPAGRLAAELTEAVTPADGKALGGSVLLREIQALPNEVQAQFFRIIEDRSGPHSDLRFMATASEALEPLVAIGSFRQDLLYRLSVFVLRMPPLRDRISDLPAMIDYFLDLDAANTGRRIKVTDQALRTLMRYPWPGNVRQLRAALERAATNMAGSHMRNSDLPEEIREWQMEGKEDSSAPVPTLADAEKSAILAAMKYTHGDKMKAAQLLGIGRTTLYRKLEEYK